MPDLLRRLQGMIDKNEIQHFTALELVRLRKAGGRIEIPPVRLWANMMGTLYLANKLRERLGKPLSVGNGYRPADYNAKVGGSKRSQHITFGALDLDLARGSTNALQRRLYEITADLYIEYGEEYAMGFGVYRKGGGTRVHIDTFYRRRYWKARYAAPLIRAARKRAAGHVS